MTLFQKTLSVLLAELLLCSPLTVVVAAESPSPSPSSNPAQVCASPPEFADASNEAELLEGKTVEEPLPDTLPEEGADIPEEPEEPSASNSTTTRTFASQHGEPEEDPGEGELPPYQSIDLEELKKNPLFSQETFDEFVSINHGWYDETTKRWNFCTLLGMDGLNSVVPVNYGMFNYLDKLEFPYNQIIFENPLDQYALTGETCTLFDPRTSYCDETKENRPILDINGQPILDEAGNQLTEEVPKYYDDAIWANGVWDAPKADLRLLKTLVYLVTPKERGGAGRERIKVAKIIQPTKNNLEMQGGTGNTSQPTPDPSASPTATPTPSPAATPEPVKQDSAHTYDIRNPSNPQQIATAMDISEIDNVRITTRITEQRRVGGNTTTYKYKEIPLKVAWQTDQGVASAELVGPNMYRAALSSFTINLGQILDNFDLQAELDLASIGDINSFGDVALLIGQSLVSQLLNSPTGSVNGWDLASVLESIGRAYLAQQLGLPSNALRSGTTVDELIQSVGRVTVEKAFGLPDESLIGDTSDDIFASLGRRQLETVLGAKAGSLLPYETTSQGDLLERIGAGKIEERFRLPKGAMQGNSWSDARNTAKTKFLFTAANANFVDEALGLAFQEVEGQSTNSFGFSASDFNGATSTLIEANSDGAFNRYKKIVGARAIESGIGRFTSATGTFSDANTRPQTQNFIKTIVEKYGFTYVNSAQATVPDGHTSLFRGSPEGSGTGIWLITIPSDSPLRTLSIMTDAELSELAQAALVATLRNTFGLPCDTRIPIACNLPSGYTSPEQARTLYNLIQTFWKPRIQTALMKIEAKIAETENVRSNNNQDLAPRDLRETVSVTLGQIKSYSDGLLTQMSANGQSGMSAALNLPGTIYDTNADGTLNSQVINTGDPINSFVAGNVSKELMMLIGKAYAAQATTSDPSAQAVLVSEVRSSLSNFETLQQFGIDVGNWVGKGFTADDFDRIFTKDLSSQVFKRIGEQQLLGTLWGMTDLTDVIQSAAGTDQVNGLINQAAQIARGIEFYLSRFREVQSIARSIEQQLSNLSGVTPEVADLLRSLNGIGDLSSISSVQTNARQYEPVFRIITTNAQSLRSSIERAQFLLREIAAGHPLNLSQTAQGNPTPRQGIVNDGCFSAADFRTFFQNGSSLVSTFATTIAGCRVDDALGLPLGSALAWHASNDFTFDSLILVVGKQYAKNNNVTLSDDAARAYGRQLLEGAALNKLIGAIPGLGGYLKRLGFKGSDIVDVLNGRGELVLARMGGSLMDSYFNWRMGTGAQIISPTCRDDEGKVRSCSREEATAIRMQTLAQVGLQKLGIALNFPSSLNMFPSIGDLSNLDFLTNFGIARISENMGLKPNSFYGTFGDVLSRNTKGATLQGVGWGNTPATRNLHKLATALRSAVAGQTAAQAGYINEIISNLEDLIEDMRQPILDEIRNANSEIWQDGSEAAVASRLLTGERSAHADVIDQVRDLIVQSGLDSLTQNTLDTIVSSHANANLGTTEEYTAQIVGFKKRVASLDGQYGVEAGTFKGFITGTVNAQDIAAKQAERELINTLGSTALNKLLAGTPFEELPSIFKELTKTDTCTEGVTIADFFLDVSGNIPSACSIKSISLAEITSGTSVTAIARRAFLYDHLFARSWGLQLEKSLKLQKGTLRSIALRPWQAKEIAIDQGIRLLGEQLFKLTGANSLETDDSKKVIRALHTALMSGFCPVDPHDIRGELERELVGSTDRLCTTRFDVFRSVVILRQELDKILRDRFNQTGLDSSQIGLADLATIFVGGLQGAYFLGAQELAKAVNRELSGEGSEEFRLEYNDIRNAFGQFTFTSADYDPFVTSAQADFVRSYYNCYDITNDDPTCLLSDADIIQTFATNDPSTDLTPEERMQMLDGIGSQARSDAPGLVRRRALENLQYNLYDIAAFKIDPSIPRGFSRAMLKGTMAQKYRMLGLYVANKLDLGESVFDGLLSNEAIVSLTTYVANGFSGDIDLTALSALDSWFTQKSEELLGFTLPPGTIQSLFAWGSTGFNGRAFDTSAKIRVGGAEFASLGTVLRNYGTQQLLSWADKSLGWPAGSAMQIYQAAVDIIQASDYLRFSKTTIVKLRDMFGRTNTEAAARANLKAAQAALVAVVINIVFASQIADLEQDLGLVPGTGALAVTMLVQLMWSLPVDPITLALFVGINLFGVYNVDISVRATVDGYYPYTGEYGEARSKPVEFVSPDPKSETFNAMDPVSYRAGLKHGAQFKVNQLLQDLLLMPERWSAGTGEKGENVFVEQVFTARSEDISSLDALISRPAPWQSPAGWGYGSLEDRATVIFDKTKNTYVAKPKAGYYAGFFSHDAFANHVHVRF